MGSANANLATLLFSNLAAANQNETFLSQVTYTFEGSIPRSHPAPPQVDLPKTKVHRGGAKFLEHAALGVSQRMNHDEGCGV